MVSQWLFNLRVAGAVLCALGVEFLLVVLLLLSFSRPPPPVVAVLIALVAGSIFYAGYRLWRSVRAPRIRRSLPPASVGLVTAAWIDPVSPSLTICVARGLAIAAMVVIILLELGFIVGLLAFLFVRHLNPQWPFA